MASVEYTCVRVRVCVCGIGKFPFLSQNKQFNEIIYVIAHLILRLSEGFILKAYNVVMGSKKFLHLCQNK